MVVRIVNQLLSLVRGLLTSNPIVPANAFVPAVVASRRTEPHGATSSTTTSSHSTATTSRRTEPHGAASSATTSSHTFVGSICIFFTFGIAVPILGFVTFLSIIAQTVYMEYRIGVYIYPLF